MGCDGDFSFLKNHITVNGQVIMYERLIGMSVQGK